MSQPYIQELYIRRLYQNGWPVTLASRKSFNKKFYEDNSVHGPTLVKRAVRNLLPLIKKQKITIWAKRDSELEAIYVAVLADFKKKYSGGNYPQHSPQQKVSRLNNRQIKEEPTDEWKPMVIRKDRVWMSREEQQKAQMRNKEMEKTRSDDGHKKSITPRGIVHIIKQLNSETPLRCTAENTNLQPHSLPIKMEAHSEDMSKHDAMILKLKRTSDLEKKNPAVWKIVDSGDKSKNATPIKNAVELGVPNLKSLSFKQEMCDWESMDGSEMDHDVQKEQIQKKIQHLDNDALTVEWKKSYDAKHKKIVSKLEEELKVTKFHLSQMSNKVKILDTVVKDKELVIQFLKSQSTQADKSIVDGSFDYNPCE